MQENYQNIIKVLSENIIRILSDALAHFEHEYLHLLNIIHTIQFQIIKEYSQRIKLGSTGILI